MFLRRFAWFITDIFEIFSCKRQSTTPGKRLRFMVGPFNDPATYEQDAKDFIESVLSRIKLPNNSKVLEVGCGSGRLIFELFRNKPKYHYFGFDIIPELIRWSKHISTRLHGKFEFTHANIYNSLYNPNGVSKGSKYAFPYDDDMFDIVIVQSVFTHMLTDDIENYLDEIYRVLKPSGKVITTWFLINKNSLREIRKGNSDFTFKHRNSNEYINDNLHPEAAVAYRENFIFSLLKNQGYKLDENMPKYGKWCGGKGLVYQDLLIMSKNL